MDALALISRRLDGHASSTTTLRARFGARTGCLDLADFTGTRHAAGMKVLELIPTGVYRRYAAALLFTEMCAGEATVIRVPDADLTRWSCESAAAFRPQLGTDRAPEGQGTTGAHNASIKEPDALLFAGLSGWQACRGEPLPARDRTWRLLTFTPTDVRNLVPALLPNKDAEYTANAALADKHGHGHGIAGAETLPRWLYSRRRSPAQQRPKHDLYQSLYASQYPTRGRHGEHSV